MKEEKLNHIEKIRMSIAYGNTDKALSQLLRFFHSEANFPKRIREESYLLSNRYNYFLRRTRLGIEDDTMKLNQVNSELLHLLDEIKYFYENENTDRLSDNLSELRRRQFLAKTLHELKLILFEAQRLSRVYPDRYELIKLIDDIQSAIDYEVRIDAIYSPPKKGKYPPIEIKKLKWFGRKEIIWFILTIILTIAMVIYFLKK